MTQENIHRLHDEPETLLLDSHVKLINPGREIVTRATEALREVGMFGLLVILAAAESVKNRQAQQHGDIEELHVYGDWVD